MRSMKSSSSLVLALLVVGVAHISVPSAAAAPAAAATLGVEQNAPISVVEKVHYRRHYHPYRHVRYHRHHHHYGYYHPYRYAHYGLIVPGFHFNIGPRWGHGHSHRYRHW